MAETATFERLEKTVKDYQDVVELKIKEINGELEKGVKPDADTKQELTELINKYNKHQEAFDQFKESIQEQIDEQSSEMKKLKMYGGDFSKEHTFIHQLNKGFSSEAFVKWAKGYSDSKREFNLKLENMSPKDIYRIKAVTMTTGGSLTETEGQVIAPDYQPSIIRPLLRETPIRSLFPQATTNSNAINYVQEDSASGCPDYTAESTTKHKMSLTLEAKQEAVRKIAGYMKISEEMLDDIPALQGYLVSRAQERYRYTEDSRLLFGTGDSGNFPGANGVTVSADSISTNPFEQAISDPNNYSALRAAAAKLMGPGNQRNEYMPDAYVMHPVDFLYLRELKGTDGHYLDRNQTVFNATDRIMTDGMGNMFFDGIPVFLSTAITKGWFLAGNFTQGAQIFDRKGVNIRFYDQNEDDPITNRITIVIEGRLALVTYRPKAFVYEKFEDVVAVLATT